ncbi:hypothetical protein ACFYMB_31270 [Micromonospora haikouensis]|uniref:hypothetical protein n=1 Tax=Micromonospora haikouensis TaxID=686309 RepID=UPI0036CB4BB1
MEQVGADGIALLRAVYEPNAPTGGSAVAAVEVLRQVWVQQYWYDESGQLRWREAKALRARKSREGTTRRSRVATTPDAAHTTAHLLRSPAAAPAAPHAPLPR